MWARNLVGSFDRNQKSAARMLTTFPFLLLGSNGHDTHRMNVFDRTRLSRSRPFFFGNLLSVGKSFHNPIERLFDRVLDVDRVGNLYYLRDEKTRRSMMNPSWICYPIWPVGLPTCPAWWVTLPVSLALDSWTCD